MNNRNNELSQKQKEFSEFLEKASNQVPAPSNYKSIEEVKGDIKKDVKEDLKEVIHLNSLITKNISLFTKNPNYKLLAWLIVQLTIFTLFILTATFLKNNFVPYINSL